MNTNNMKIKTLSIGEFKIYSDGGILNVRESGQVFNLLNGKKIAGGCRFFSIKDSEVFNFIKKLLKCVTNKLKRNLGNDNI